jgi:hypothetical protein
VFPSAQVGQIEVIVSLPRDRGGENRPSCGDVRAGGEESSRDAKLTKMYSDAPNYNLAADQSRAIRLRGRLLAHRRHEALDRLLTNADPAALWLIQIQRDVDSDAHE